MKQIQRGPAIVGAALLLATFVSVPVLGAPAAAGKAALVVDPARLDFGRMAQHQVRNAEVTIRNGGTATLEIYGVEPSCGCTVAELKVKELAPGQSTVLPVTFDSKAFSGPQHKTIRLSSNDPDQPNFDIQIEALVLVPLLIDPPHKQLGFGQVRRGDPKTRSVTLTAMEAAELTVTATRWNKAVFDVEVRHDEGGNPASEVVLVKLNPAAPLGEHREFMTLRTDLADMPSVDVELFATIVQDVMAQPERVNFRYVARDQKLEGRVRVSAVDPAVKFKITGVEIDLPGFRATVEPTQPGKEAFVHFEGTPLPETDARVVAAKGRMAGKLTIKTDLPGTPELQVEILYLVRV